MNALTLPFLGNENIHPYWPPAEKVFEGFPIFFLALIRSFKQKLETEGSELNNFFCFMLDISVCEAT